MKHVWDCPNEWIQLDETGHLATLPEHFAGDPDPDSPAYFINARPELRFRFLFLCVAQGGKGTGGSTREAGRSSVFFCVFSPVRLKKLEANRKTLKYGSTRAAVTENSSNPAI